MKMSILVNKKTFLNQKTLYSAFSKTLKTEKSLFLKKSCFFSSSSPHNFDYDYFVIGGGSGGLASAKEAASYGKKVAVADYVVPTPHNTKWGLGGTCVNVGCIPKKLFHYSALKMEELSLYQELGLTIDYDKKTVISKIPVDEDYQDTTKDSQYEDKEFVKPVIKWEILKKRVQQYVKKLNFGHRSKLRETGVTYYNKQASFIDKNTLLLKDHKNEDTIITADKILISVGGRPSYGEYINNELCITSDDIFSLTKPPGKTLVVGASYIALETAGFLNGLGYDTTVMVRSVLLRGFDQDMAKKIGKNLEDHGVRFIKQTTPVSFTKKEEIIIVEYDKEGVSCSEEYDTVLLAIGREAVTSSLGLEKAGVITNPRNKKIVVNDKEETSVSNVFAIGDCAEGRPELTPPAIRAGRLLAKRLFNNESVVMNYKNIATTVFTPLEYACVGLSEEEAVNIYQEENVVVYHSEFTSLEWNLNMANTDTCYCKVIIKKDDDVVVGIHILSPNAGEIMQGFSVAFNKGLTKKDLDETVSIHPTSAEELTLLKINKADGDGKKEDC